MRKSARFFKLAARDSGLTIALVAAMLLGAGNSSYAHVTGLASTSVGNDDNSNPSAVEAAIEAAQERLESAYAADKGALEKARESLGDQNDTARDLLKKASADLKAIFETADVALDVDGDSATLDAAAITALVDQAISDMDAVVSTALAALPADQVKVNDDEGGDVED